MILYVLLEGNDDERFFEAILKRKFEEKYLKVRIWKYAEKPKSKIRKFIDIIEDQTNWDYLYFCDFDSEICIAKKKDVIKEVIERIDVEKIIVVREEIESWYLAGIDNDFLRNLGADSLIESVPKYITKEQFNNLIPKDMPRIMFLRKILHNYEISKALKNSKSLGYVFRKFLD